MTDFISKKDVWKSLITSSFLIFVGFYMMGADTGIAVLINVGWVFVLGGVALFVIPIAQWFMQDKDEMRRRNNVS